jgi:hypothetical protein
MRLFVFHFEFEALFELICEENGSCVAPTVAWPVSPLTLDSLSFAALHTRIIGDLRCCW